MLTIDKDLIARGWIIRDATANSAPILVRGARQNGDGYCETKNGFVYAETAEEAHAYDAAHNYGETHDVDH